MQRANRKSDSSRGAIPAAPLLALLKLLGDLACSGEMLTKRREQFLARFAVLIGADRGHWAWGRGHPARGATVPVALYTFGMDEQQKADHIGMALSPELDRFFRQPIIATLTDQATHRRGDLYNDRQWKDLPF